MSGTGKQIPILVTLDVHDQPKIDYYLQYSAEALAAASIPATYFVPADVFVRYKAATASISTPHQIACHGLYHNGQSEFYDLIPSGMQRDYIRRATDILADGLGRHPGAFRAPGFRISGTALTVLEECGYYADSSVNSGRLGITSSYTKENGWFRAPRLPYHPDRQDPFRRGNLSLWEIPVSAFILPLTINTAVAMGSCLSRLFATLLYFECRLRPKPLLYMAHPEDLCQNGPERGCRRFSFKQLLPSEHGFTIRHYLSAKNQEDYYRINGGILDCLRGLKGVEFTTVDSYVAWYLS